MIYLPPIHNVFTSNIFHNPRKPQQVRRKDSIVLTISKTVFKKGIPIYSHENIISIYTEKPP